MEKRTLRKTSLNNARRKETSSRPQPPVQGSHGLVVLCDYLDVSMPAGVFPYTELGNLLLNARFVGAKDHFFTDGSANFAPPRSWRGVLKINHNWHHSRISASGEICSYLRHCGYFEEYLAILASVRHTVTRLDAALDLDMDGADLVETLDKAYSGGVVHLGRKGIGTCVYLSTRSDGRKTGTWYAGRSNRGAKLTACVYDKAHQMLTEHGEKLPPTARIEVRARKGYGVTLHDALHPEAFFWHATSSAIIRAPEGSPQWTPNHDAAWRAPARICHPAHRVKRHFDSVLAPQLLAAIAVADEAGPDGRTFFHTLVDNLFMQLSA